MNVFNIKSKPLRLFTVQLSIHLLLYVSIKWIADMETVLLSVKHLKTPSTNLIPFASFVVVALPFCGLNLFYYFNKYVNKGDGQLLEKYKFIIPIGVISSTFLCFLITRSFQNLDLQLEKDMSNVHNLVQNITEPHVFKPMVTNRCIRATLMGSKENHAISTYFGDVSDFNYDVDDYSISSRISAIVDTLIQYFRNENEKYSDDFTWEHYDHWMYTREDYIPPAEPIDNCFEHLREVLFYSLAPQCDNYCEPYKPCYSKCQYLESICGDLLHMARLDPGFYSVGFNSSGLHNLYNALNDTSNDNNYYKTEISLTEMDIIKPVISAIFNYECDSTVFASTGCEIESADTIHSVNGNCTWNAAEESDAMKDEYLIKTVKYDQWKLQYSNKVYMKAIEIRRRYSNTIKDSISHPTIFLVWLLSVQIPYFSMLIITCKHQAKILNEVNTPPSTEKSLSNNLKFNDIWNATANLVLLLSTIYIGLMIYFFNYLYFYSILYWTNYVLLIVILLNCIFRLFFKVAASYDYGRNYLRKTELQSNKIPALTPDKNDMILTSVVSPLETVIPHTTTLDCRFKLLGGIHAFNKAVTGVVKGYRRLFSFKYKGTLLILRLSILKLIEIVIQVSSLGVLIKQLSAFNLIIFISVLSSDCLYFGFISMRPMKLSLLRNYIVDIMFETIYVLLNITNRWGVVNDLDLISALSIVVTLFMIQRKLVICLQINIMNKVSNIISSKAAMKSNPGHTSKKQLIVSSTRRTPTLSASNGFQKKIAIASGFILILMGLLIPIYILTRLISMNHYCQDYYTPCVWKGIEPKIHFHSGFFGELDCGESSIERIIGKDCYGVEELTSSILGDGKLKFPKLNYMDISNTNVSSIPPWLLEIDTLIVDNTPLAAHPLLTGNNLSSLNQNYGNVFGDTATTIDLSGQNFTAFNFLVFESKFRYVEVINLNSNNLSGLKHLNFFIKNMRPFIISNGILLNFNISYNCIDLSESGSVLHEFMEDYVSDALSSLDLRSNCINKLPIQFMQKFKSVDLSLYDNPIYSIDWSNYYCTVLTVTMDDSGNTNRIPYWIEHLNNLQYLKLTSCFIEDIETLIELKTDTLIRLDLRDNAIKKFPLATNNLHSKLEAVILRNNAISQLSRNTFQNMINLIEIDLSANNIEILPAHLLSGLTSLRELNLAHNKLETLSNDQHRDTFKGLISLEKLYLESNSIKNLHEKIFHGLKSMTEINLSYNRIDQVPPGTFNGLENLKIIDLWGNSIEFLPEGLFLGSKKYLEEILCYENRIKSIHENLFTSMKSLVFVALARNDLTTLSPNLFEGNYPSLEILDIRDNYIDELPKGIFDDLGSLTDLHMSSNRIQTLPMTIFHNLGNLVRLRIYDNDILFLPETVFRGLTSLQDLVLDDNDIRAIPASTFNGLYSLSFLNLDDNYISNLSNDTFNGLSQLKELDLDYNSIESLPTNIFSDLISLETLYLRSNYLQDLTKDIFKYNTKLIWLSFYNNRITTIENLALNELLDLELIDFGWNQIEELPQDAFKGLVYLDYLVLNDNFIKILPENIFSGLVLLKRLDISNNLIEELPNGIFDGLKSLLRLKLYGNPLKSVYPIGIFDDLSSLTALEISFEIPSGSASDIDPYMFRTLTSLRELHIAYSSTVGCSYFALPSDVRCLYF